MKKNGDLSEKITKEFEKIITLHHIFEKISFSVQDIIEKLISSRMKEVTDDSLHPIDTAEEYLIVRSKDAISRYFDWSVGIVFDRLSESDINYDQPASVRLKNDFDRIRKEASALDQRMQEIYDKEIGSDSFLILNISVIDNILNKEKDDDTDIEDTLLSPEAYFLDNFGYHLDDLTGVQLTAIKSIDIDPAEYFAF